MHCSFGWPAAAFSKRSGSKRETCETAKAAERAERSEASEAADFRGVPFPRCQAQQRANGEPVIPQRPPSAARRLTFVMCHFQMPRRASSRGVHGISAETRPNREPKRLTGANQVHAFPVQEIHAQTWSRSADHSEKQISTTLRRNLFPRSRVH